MSAPGRPKRESSTRRGEVSSINAPGRHKRESSTRRGEMHAIDVPGALQAHIHSAAH